MLQRLPIVLVQIKAGNLPGCQFINSLYRAKVISKEVCNNIMNSMEI